MGVPKKIRIFVALLIVILLSSNVLAGNAIISPQNPTSGQDLTCTYSNMAPSSYSWDYEFHWYKNDAEESALTETDFTDFKNDPSSSLSGSLVKAGDRWACKVYDWLTFAVVQDGVASVTVQKKVNRAPIITSTPITTATENQLYSYDVEATDPDGDALTYLLATQPSGMSVNSATGLITWTPDLTQAGSHNVVVEVSDGSLKAAQSFTIVISALIANRKPNAHTQSAETDEDTSKRIILTGFDADGDKLIFLIVSQPAKGKISGFNSATGQLDYIPDENYYGADSFTFKVNDGTDDSDAATVTINVKAVNDAPAANDDSAATNEDTSVLIDVLANDNDVEDGKPAIDAVTAQPAKGTAAIENGKIRYSPNANANGADAFTYRVRDKEDATDTANVRITINPVSDAPVAQDVDVETNEDTPKPISLKATDADGDKLTFKIESQPAFGALSNFNPSTGQLTYTPKKDYNGQDSFAFSANDGSANSNTAAVKIKINPVNDPAVWQPLSNKNIDEDSPDNTIVYKNLKALCSDVDDQISMQITSAHNNYNLFFSANDLLIKSLKANYNGKETVRLSCNGASGSFELTVNPVNDAPVTESQDVVTTEGTPKDIALKGSDVDGDPLTFSVTLNPQNGNIQNFNSKTGALTYTPNAGFRGKDSFKFKAIDSSGAQSQEAVVSITVAKPGNRAPVFTVFPETLSVNENHVLPVKIQGKDEDGDAITYRVSPNELGIEINAVTGEFAVQPRFDEGNEKDRELIDTHKDYIVTFGITDGIATTSRDLKIKVNNVNREPFFISAGHYGYYDLIDLGYKKEMPSFNVREGEYIEFDVSASDFDADSLIYLAENLPQGSKFDEKAKKFSWTPGYDKTGTYVMNLKVTEKDRNNGIAPQTAILPVKIIVGNFNRPPTIEIKPPGDKTVTEGQKLEFDAAASDPDEGQIAAALSANTPLPAGASFKNGKFSWTPDRTQGNYGKRDYKLTFEAEDKEGLAASPQEVTISVIDTNHPPSVKNIYPVGVSVFGYSARLKWEASDPDSYDENRLKFDVYAYRDGAAPKQILKNWDLINWDAVNRIFSSEAIYSYSQLGWHNWYVVVRDTEGWEVKGDISRFLAEPVEYGGAGAPPQPPTPPAPNNAPVITSIAVTSATEGQAYSYDVDASDADGDTLAYSLTTKPNGMNINSATGLITWTPSFTQAGSHNVVVQVSDNNGGTASQSFTINVADAQPANTAPSANDDAVVINEDTAVLIDVLANDNDAEDGKPVIDAVTAQGSKGTASIESGKIRYSPNANANGADTFNYRAKDSAGAADTASVFITINPVNDIPIANDDLAATNEDTSVLIDVLANDNDAEDGKPVIDAIISSPVKGAAAIESGKIRYTPNSNSNGADTFTYRAKDSQGATDTAVAAITINPVNDAPVVTSTPVTSATEGQAYSYDVEASDIDGDTLTFSLTTKPTGMGISSNTGLISWAPAFDQSGSNNVVVQVSDGQAAASQNFNINVADANRAPAANSQSITTNEDTPREITLTGSDADGDALKFSIVANPTKGIVSNFNQNTGKVTYTPNANFNGADSLTFKANDGSLDSNTATVSIAVTNVNDAPIASPQSVIFNFNTPVSINLQCSDVDNDPLTFTSANPSNGALSGTGKTRVYTPNFNFKGSDSFAFKCSDGTLDSNTATISLIFNDAPAITSTPITIAVEGINYAYNVIASDAEGDPITFGLEAAPEGMVINPATGSISWMPQFKDIGIHNVVVRATDNKGASSEQAYVLTVLENAQLASKRLRSAKSNLLIPRIIIPNEDYVVPGEPLLVHVVLNNREMADIDELKVAASILELGVSQTSDKVRLPNDNSKTIRLELDTRGMIEGDHYTVMVAISSKGNRLRKVFREIVV